MAELMRHDVLPEGREKGEVAECCRARLARDGGSVASAEAFGGESTEARGEGASGESENRLRSAVMGPRASRRIVRGQQRLAGFDFYEV